MTFFGSGWENIGIEIPEPDADAQYYRAKQVLRDHVGEQWYFSTVTGKWRRSFVHTPPDYGTNTKGRYPVLYLLHGWGEDETGWFRQGHVDFIMDNLIAAGKAKPMIVMMDNLNALKPGESATLYAARGLVPAPGRLLQQDAEVQRAAPQADPAAQHQPHAAEKAWPSPRSPT